MPKTNHKKEVCQLFKSLNKLKPNKFFSLQYSDTSKPYDSEPPIRVAVYNRNGFMLFEFKVTKTTTKKQLKAQFMRFAKIHL